RQFVGGTDARKHQQLWRTDGTCGEQDFPLATGRVEAAASLVFDADDFVLLDHEPATHRPGNDGQVPTAHGRAKVTDGGTATTTIVLGHLVEVGAELRLAVEIGIERMSCLLGGKNISMRKDVG